MKCIGLSIKNNTNRTVITEKDTGKNVNRMPLSYLSTI